MDSISADLPELIALASMASVDPERMAAAFNDPENLFDHLTRDDLHQLKLSCDRLAVLQAQLTASADRYMVFARGVLVGVEAARKQEGRTDGDS